MYKSQNDMSYEQVKAIMLEHGLEEYDDSEGTNFRFVKGKNHIKIFERFKPMIRGGITGNLYVEVLENYKTQCSKNGHINIKLVQDEKELRNILDSVKEYYLRKWNVNY